VKPRLQRRGRTGASVVALLLTAALCACATVPSGTQPLNVTLADLRPAQVGLLEQMYAMRVRVQNTDERDVALRGLSFELELNGEPFVKGVSRQDVVAPGLGETVLEIKGVSTLGGILDQVKLMRESGKDRITYRLHGSFVLASGSRLPFDAPGTLDLSALREAGR
jgi:LEA14-like dessication related protein